LVPLDFATVDDNHRHEAVLSLIPLDSGSHHAIGDLEAEFTFLQMFEGEGAANLVNKPREQRKQILLGIADDLELIARRLSIPDRECVNRDARTQQPGAKMELV